MFFSEFTLTLDYKTLVYLSLYRYSQFSTRVDLIFLVLEKPLSGEWNHGKQTEILRSEEKFYCIEWENGGVEGGSVGEKEFVGKKN